MYQLTPIPTLRTNYVWCITSQHCPGRAVIVDPGEAAPVLAHLKHHQLELCGILITHHHHDHTNGLDAILAESNVPVYVGAHESVSQATVKLADQDTFNIPALALELTAIHLPGHTHGHIAFYTDEILFSGDTLFAGGCGKLYEGTAVELHASLQKLMQLPMETQVYCGHEYTVENLKFGLQVEPDNVDMQSKLTLMEIMRADKQCTLPTSLAEEAKTNIFLRCHVATVHHAAEQFSGQRLACPDDVFAVLRSWKSGL